MTKIERGDIVSRNIQSRWFHGQHMGIVVEPNSENIMRSRVVHMQGNAGKSDSIPREDSLEEFAAGKLFQVNPYVSRYWNKNKEQTAQRADSYARKAVLWRPYWALDSTCQNFVYDCCKGTQTKIPVGEVASALGTIGTIGIYFLLRKYNYLPSWREAYNKMKKY